MVRRGVGAVRYASKNFRYCAVRTKIFPESAVRNLQNGDHNQKHFWKTWDFFRIVNLGTHNTYITKNCFSYNIK